VDLLLDLLFLVLDCTVTMDSDAEDVHKIWPWLGMSVRGRLTAALFSLSCIAEAVSVHPW